jgi:hypothetical protein
VPECSPSPENPCSGLARNTFGIWGTFSTQSQAIFGLKKIPEVRSNPLGWRLIPTRGVYAMPIADAKQVGTGIIVYDKERKIARCAGVIFFVQRHAGSSFTPLQDLLFWCQWPHDRAGYSSWRYSAFTSVSLRNLVKRATTSPCVAQA